MPDTTTADHDDSECYRDVAEALIAEHGWERATFVATAVRGFVYGLPAPSPYRDTAEAIYERLGWEQAALLASWFRDARSRPGRH
ncbi:hypothetical protein [Streptomyces sp. NPDC046909]|uniref:hypothetical protein n=1 Tax=Streptomyces sp. NPDC046909 TaxID=3155617 RepID=UPI0033D64E4F